MQYIFLKNILETVLSNYQCPQCQNKTNEQSIQIHSISHNTVGIHVHCHICSAVSELKAEINPMASQLLQNEDGRKYLEDFLKNGGTIGATMNNAKSTWVDNPNAIKDEDIIQIYNDLKNAKSIEDLMN